MTTTYYKVKIKIEVSDEESGRLKKVTRPILIEADSPIEAETAATKVYSNLGLPFKIVSASEDPIVQVINRSDVELD